MTLNNPKARAFALFLVLGVTVSGCLKQLPPIPPKINTPADNAVRESRAEFIDNAVRPWTILDDSQLQHLSGFIKREILEGEHAGKTVEYVRYTLDGLELSGIFVNKKKDRPLFSTIEISSPSWNIGKGLRVGSSESEVISLLGVPEEQLPDSITYCGFTNCMTFSIRDSTVANILFDLYVD